MNGSDALYMHTEAGSVNCPSLYRRIIIIMTELVYPLLIHGSFHTGLPAP